MFINTNKMLSFYSILLAQHLSYKTFYERQRFINFANSPFYGWRNWSIKHLESKPLQVSRKTEEIPSLLVLCLWYSPKGKTIKFNKMKRGKFYKCLQQQSRRGVELKVNKYLQIATTNSLLSGPSNTQIQGTTSRGKSYHYKAVQFVASDIPLFSPW